MRTFVITWDSVAVHHSHVITNRFADHPRMMSLFLPPYSPFLNPTEEFFQPGGGRCTIIDHMTKCPSWMQWLQRHFS
ncbi:hypothetical protein MHYP_G00089150 [Metynnis hypsauchen]